MPKTPDVPAGPGRRPRAVPIDLSEIFTDDLRAGSARAEEVAQSDENGRAEVFIRETRQREPVESLIVRPNGRYPAQEKAGAVTALVAAVFPINQGRRFGTITRPASKSAIDDRIFAVLCRFMVER